MSEEDITPEPPAVPHSLMRYFSYEHLTEPMRGTARAFKSMAKHVDDSLPNCSEKTVALRKLLEAKDAAVRASLDLM